MKTKPSRKIIYALHESMIESCLFRLRAPIIEAKESFAPENRKENAIDNINTLRMVSDILKDTAVRVTNTTKLIPERYLT